MVWSSSERKGGERVGCWSVITVEGIKGYGAMARPGRNQGRLEFVLFRGVHPSHFHNDAHMAQTIREHEVVEGWEGVKQEGVLYQLFNCSS